MLEPHPNRGSRGGAKATACVAAAVVSMPCACIHADPAPRTRVCAQAKKRKRSEATRAAVLQGAAVDDTSARRRQKNVAMRM